MEFPLQHSRMEDPQLMILKDSQQGTVSDVLDVGIMAAPSTPEVGMKDGQVSDVEDCVQEFSAAEKADAAEEGRKAAAAATDLKAWVGALCEIWRPRIPEGAEAQAGPGPEVLRSNKEKVLRDQGPIRVITDELTDGEAAALASVRAKLQGAPRPKGQAKPKKVNPKQATKQQSKPKQAPKEQSKLKQAPKDQAKPKQVPKEQVKPKPKQAPMKRPAAATDVVKKMRTSAAALAKALCSCHDCS
jgi:hypothetical protein